MEEGELSGIVIRKRNLTLKMLEFYLWLIVGALIPIQAWLDIYNGRASIGEVIQVRIATILLGASFLLLPLLFSLIFGNLPFESLRNRVKRKRFSRENSASEAIDIQIPQENGEVDIDSDMAPEKMLSVYAERSERTAKSIYSRAGVYLRARLIKS